MAITLPTAVTYTPDPRRGYEYGLSVDPETGVFGRNFFTRNIADKDRITINDFVVEPAPTASTAPIRQYRSSAPTDTGEGDGFNPDFNTLPQYESSFLDSLGRDLGLSSGSYPTDEEIAKGAIMDALMSDQTYSTADKAGDAASFGSVLPGIGGLSALANLGAGAVEVNRGNQIMEAINAEKMGALDAIGLGLNPFRGAEDSFVDRAYQAAIDNPNFDYNKNYGQYNKMADAMFNAANPLSSVELTDAERALGSQLGSMSTDAVPLYSPRSYDNINSNVPMVSIPRGPEFGIQNRMDAQDYYDMVRPQSAEMIPSVPTAGYQFSILDREIDPRQEFASINRADNEIYRGDSPLSFGRSPKSRDDFVAYDSKYDPTTGTLGKGYAFSGLDPLDQTISDLSASNRMSAMGLSVPNTSNRPMSNFSTYLDNVMNPKQNPSILNRMTDLFSPSTSGGSLFGSGNYALDASGANKSMNDALNAPAYGPSVGYGYGGSVESASRGGLFGPQAQAFQATLDKGITFNDLFGGDDSSSGGISQDGGGGYDEGAGTNSGQGMNE
tara:strand:+ start:11494 stop:13158 length:1665 start_codon:yes stop_codon:yes gene_type:complete